MIKIRIYLMIMNYKFVNFIATYQKINLIFSLNFSFRIIHNLHYNIFYLNLYHSKFIMFFRTIGSYFSVSNSQAQVVASAGPTPCSLAEVVSNENLRAGKIYCNGKGNPAGDAPNCTCECTDGFTGPRCVYCQNSNHSFQLKKKNCKFKEIVFW